MDAVQRLSIVFVLCEELGLKCVRASILFFSWLLCADKKKPFRSESRTASSVRARVTVGMPASASTCCSAQLSNKPLWASASFSWCTLRKVGMFVFPNLRKVASYAA